MTDPIICVHTGRSTWQGPASAAPRKEDRMTHDPEAAERLADWLASEAKLMSLDYAYSPITTAPMEQGAALIRAQAAEIARLTARQPSPTPALQPDKPDGNTLRGALSDFVAMGEQYGWDNAQTGRAILMKNARAALIDTPAPPAEPAGDALRRSLVEATDYIEALIEAEGEILLGGQVDPCAIVTTARAALAAAPAPQPDADEREAMAVAMSKVIRDNIDIEWAEAKTAADALLAAGWSRKREEG